MSNTSRTGLVPTSNKKRKLVKKIASPKNGLPTKFEAVPMALSLRPLGGLLNPFAKSCSVLCNHPAPTAVKEIIYQLKSTMVSDAKNVPQFKEKVHIDTTHGTDNIPEDLFRRYADTDSRPLTPTPTVASIRTRASGASSFVNIRRCITPEWDKNELFKRKKIILDLRKTHSQETLYWKPSSDLSQSAVDYDLKSKSASIVEEKKVRRPKGDEQISKSSQAAASGTDLVANGAKKLSQTCINEHVLDDENVRRGKKRKKVKPVPVKSTQAFHLSEDPETQVATIGPDSMNPSTRASLVPTSVSLLPEKKIWDNEPVLLKGSFLTNEAFQVLKTELDIDVIENTFDRYLNRARREAIKYIPQKTKGAQNILEEFEKLSVTGQSKMPRKFSKSATRFEVPFDLQSLKDMSVLEYLSKYVWLSRQRKQLYKRVFLKYITKIEEPSDEAKTENYPLSDYVERTMSIQHLPRALKDALEFHGNDENISEMLRLLNYEEIKVKELNFRTWCGIASFAERLALADPNCTDSCDELEKADFNSMEQRLEKYSVPNNLRDVFEIIKGTHTNRL